MTTHLLTGHYIDDQGLLESGALLVEHTRESADPGYSIEQAWFVRDVWRVADISGGEITARLREGIVIIEGSREAWRFVADKAQCRHIGLPIVGRTVIDARPELDRNDLCALLARIDGQAADHA